MAMYLDLHKQRKANKQTNKQIRHSLLLSELLSYFTSQCTVYLSSRYVNKVTVMAACKLKYTEMLVESRVMVQLFVLRAPQSVLTKVIITCVMSKYYC